MAEQRFTNDQLDFDEAWQEMLNHATTKVVESERQKAASLAEHERKTALSTKAEKVVQELEVKYKDDIRKARQYYELKAYYDRQLCARKGKISELSYDFVKFSKCSFLYFR